MAQRSGGGVVPIGATRLVVDRSVGLALGAITVTPDLLRRYRGVQPRPVGPDAWDVALDFGGSVLQCGVRTTQGDAARAAYALHQLLAPESEFGTAQAFGAVLRPVPPLSGKRPVSAFCPMCGSPDFVAIAPTEAVTFEKDRQCTHCRTEYSRPTPLVASIALMLIGAMFIAAAVAIFALERKESMLKFPLFGFGALVFIGGIKTILRNGSANSTPAELS